MLIYLDTETTGLDPLRHDIVEIAFAVDDDPIISGVVPHTLDGADLKALEINRYFEREIDDEDEPEDWILPLLTRRLIGATVVASNPAFDTAFLRRKIGFAPWHHRLFDVSAYAAGVFGWSGLKGLADVAAELRGRGYEIEEPDHTARQDVVVLRQVHLALVALGSGKM